MRSIRQCLCLLLMCLYTVCGFATQEIIVSDPWIAEAPPNAKVMAAYMRIDNHSAQARRLLAIKNDYGLQVALHRSIERGGIVIMKPVNDIMLPANGHLLLTPGGYHAMIHAPARDYRQGNHLQMSLQFADGTMIRIVAEVKRRLR